ncbi:class I SAM-dependent methyltransferase, partial [Paenibacillus sp. MCAF20]
MSNHYYSESPEVKHNRQQHTFDLRGYAFRFMTDAGVFSKTGVDYGSRVLIDVMEIAGDAKVLDVGCGYGPIGLTAAKLAQQGHVTMIDINERAVELSRENARLNGISNITVVQSDIYAAVKEQRFNTIVT